MGYQELVELIHKRSGLSDQESKIALESTVESIAVHLDESERKDFASQLPERLQDMALSVYPSAENTQQDILTQIMYLNDVPEERAQRQLASAWEALQTVISPTGLSRIRSQLTMALPGLA